MVISSSRSSSAQGEERYAIVGGGILGMTLAHRLAQAGKQVTLFEASPELGGLASAWMLGDITWDRHYHVTLLSDLCLRNLLKELRLEQDMQWVETKTGCYMDGNLYSVSNAIEFLRFPPLGLIDKIRLGFTILYASKIRDWKQLEKISVVDWLSRWSGKHTFQKFWLPLLRAKLGENYKKASAAFIWAIIARLYAARRTGLKKEMFGYLPGGYARLLERFAEVLTEEGVEIRLGAVVQQVQSAEGQVKLQTAGWESFDRVILTTAAPIAAQVCPQLDSEERDRLKNIQYQGIICASLLLKQPLSPYYVTNITDTWVPFTGVIEMTTLVEPDYFHGNTLVYLPKYIAPDDPAFSLSDSELQEKFVSALERMYSHFDRSDVLSFKVSRVKYVLAISTLNYSEHLPPMHTSIPGVHIINSAHILNGTLNVNETVQLAESAAAELLTLSKSSLAVSTR
ncbi:MAG: NAD(P)/FAD-dependent oxidoreductase [Drouetiella hepatica Uher 2000/2452]|jgi:protoporphyrinogen oxidase|uniref:NAD(P)/FAD-dependent oxidoreductase n=1 Tax=Drouetiella hepatica Uher 2000/2452 TaxID=904376 RepID=A0A951QFB6_9CYAN|nr:NAD(P)/FAD-dependent oxidoreductase [Drouetiella hepatica Uher 2000/2452]